MAKKTKEVNKTEKFIFSMLDLKSFEPTLSIEREVRGSQYVSWGDNNRYPQYLWDTYSNCTTLQSILNGSMDFTFGDGIEIMGLSSDFKYINSHGDSIQTVVQKLITDFWVFGGYAFQVIYNRFHIPIEIIYMDFIKLRTDKYGNEIYLCDSWGRYGSNTSHIKYNKFDPSKRDELNQIFYYKGTKTRGVYPVPDYSAALVSAEIQIEIGKFHYNTILNNFNVNGILNIPTSRGVTDDEKAAISRAIDNKFSGSENAGTLMINWSDGENGVTFERLNDDQFDKKYEALSISTTDNLFNSLRAHPQLFGMQVPSGFANIEYEQAYKLYNRTAIKPKQNSIIESLKQVLGSSVDIEFLPFTMSDGSDINVSDIPSQILDDLTQNERRNLVGFEAIDNIEADNITLAEKIGLGGVQAIQNLIINSDIPEDSKVGAFEVIFGISKEDTLKLIGQ